ncbi:MAG TPA: polyphosphate polymerase domain-containing protein [Vicinamibacterales bacterium]|jgi:hypothetical protein|nr:polyphosphate polymerase domain-containing protein [Vicinamibacterales bacterium]
MLQGTSTSETREAAREIKFLVTPDVAASMLEWSRSRLMPDPHAGGQSGDEYQTASLYFDTATFAVYRRQGSYKRSKYRVRRYGSADVVFLERKLRTDQLLSKRRTIVPLADLPLVADPSVGAAWPAYWFAQRIASRQLRPACQIAYRRHARVGFGPYGPFRLTFDDEIVAQPASALAFEGIDGLRVLTSHTIVEMKFRVELPAVFKHLVETFALEPASISKYRLGLDVLRGHGVEALDDHVVIAAAEGADA